MIKASLSNFKINSGLTLVFMMLLLDSIGIAMVVPILPKLLQELTGDTITQAAVHGSLLVTSYAAMQFLFAPLVGAASDKWGRRPILLISILTFAIDNLICALAGSYAMLLVGRLLSGISGASYTACMAYIADISTKNTRTRNFSMIEIAFGLGFLVGPMIGAFLGGISTRAPFYAAAILALGNFIISWWLLPETLVKKERREVNWAKVNPISSLLNLKKYPRVAGVAITDFFYAMSFSVWMIWAYISMARYGWNEQHVGISLTIFAIGQIVITMFVLPRMSKVMSDRKLALLGLTMVLISYAGYALAISEWIVYLVFFFTLLEFVAPAPLRSIAASQVNKKYQGEVQGAIASLRSLTSIIAPTLYAMVFGYSTIPLFGGMKFYGLPFVLSFFFALIAIVVFYKFVYKKPDINSY